MREEVRGLAEFLGINPLEIANEGKAVIGVAPERAEAVLKALKRHPQGREAAIIGEATADYPGKVILVTEVGGKRFLEPPLGDPVPRICYPPSLRITRSPILTWKSGPILFAKET